MADQHHPVAPSWCVAFDLAVGVRAVRCYTKRYDRHDDAQEMYERLLGCDYAEDITIVDL